MTNPMVIRELIGVERIATIFPLLSQVNPVSEAAFLQRLGEMVAMGNYRCIAGYFGERMVAAAGFWTGTQFWCGKYIEADHVVVAADLRSQGIGAQLMAWIEAEGERIGCTILRIAMVLGRERTHQFYDRLGFFDDGLLMVKALPLGAEAFPEYVARPAAS